MNALLVLSERPLSVPVRRGKVLSISWLNKAARTKELIFDRSSIGVSVPPAFSLTRFATSSSSGPLVLAEHDDPPASLQNRSMQEVYSVSFAFYVLDGASHFGTQPQPYRPLKRRSPLGRFG